VSLAQQLGRLGACSCQNYYTGTIADLAPLIMPALAKAALRQLPQLYSWLECRLIQIAGVQGRQRSWGAMGRNSETLNP